MDADLLKEIESLPDDWHGSGSFSSKVLRGIAAHIAQRAVAQSAETGTGKSTLLFSHVSKRHLVFTKDDSGDGDSLDRVRSSPLLNAANVEFVLGFTQRTLPRHEFDAPLDLVLIDGPHGYPFPDLEYYCLYPHMAENALLIVDDTQIPTIQNLYQFLKQDDMFAFLEQVESTAFFRRTSAPTFDPLGDGWWRQKYNRRRATRRPLTQAAKSTPLGQFVGRAAKRVLRRQL